MFISLFPEIMAFKTRKQLAAENEVLGPEFCVAVLSYLSLVWLFSPSAKFRAQMKSLNTNIFLIFSKTVRAVLKGIWEMQMSKRKKYLKQPITPLPRDSRGHRSR